MDVGLIIWVLNCNRNAENGYQDYNCYKNYGHVMYVL